MTSANSQRAIKRTIIAFTSITMDPYWVAQANNQYVGTTWHGKILHVQDSPNT